MSSARQVSRVRRTREGCAAGIQRGSRGRYSGQWAGERLEPKKYLAPPPYASIEEVPRDLYDRALREKLPWIQRFVNENCPRGKLREYAVAHAVAHGIDLAEVPPYSTLNTWVHRHRAFGLLGLMDAVRGDAGRPRTVSNEVAEVANVLRVGGKADPSEILRALHRHFTPDEIPNYAALRRYIRRLERDNPHLMALADEGLPGWRNKFRLALAGTNHPGGKVLAADSTVADHWVRVRDVGAPEGWRAVRLVLTVFEDVGSRLLVTYNLSLKAIDSGILMSVFRRVLFQDENYPGLISTGMPHQMLLDNGAEHQGAFRKMLERHQVEILSSPGYYPERNGRTERLIQTVQREVFGSMPGYSKSHKRFDPYGPAEREQTRRLTSLKYEPYRLELPVMALKTVEEVEAEILGWAHAYNSRPHSGLPVDSEELMAMVAKAAELDEFRGDADV